MSPLTRNKIILCYAEPFFGMLLPSVVLISRNKNDILLFYKVGPHLVISDMELERRVDRPNN